MHKNPTDLSTFLAQTLFSLRSSQKIWRSRLGFKWGASVGHRNEVSISPVSCSERKELHQNVAGPRPGMLLLPDEDPGAEPLLPGGQELRQQLYTGRVLLSECQ